ncbi:MAG: ribonuclease HI family protein [Armatimonadota bacterium]
MSESSPLFILHTDGAAKGNPGPSGIGIVLYKGSDTTEPIAAFGEYIGETTNNVAEYKGLIRGLKEALERGADRIEARTDSELMARQIAGRYKVNAPQILPLHQEACRLLSRFEKASVVHVLRGKNALADKLANQGVAAGKVPASRSTPLPRSATVPAPASAPVSFQHKHSRQVNGERWVWNVERLYELSKDLPVRKLPLSYFDDLLDSDSWFDGETPTVRAVADHARRIYEADKTRPVILAADGKLMDGGHRIAHACITGQKEIDSVQFKTDPEPDIRLKAG